MHGCRASIDGLHRTNFFTKPLFGFDVLCSNFNRQRLLKARGFCVDGNEAHSYIERFNKNIFFFQNCIDALIRDSFCGVPLRLLHSPRGLSDTKTINVLLAIRA